MPSCDALYTGSCLLLEEPKTTVEAGQKATRAAGAEGARFMKTDRAEEAGPP